MDNLFSGKNLLFAAFVGGMTWWYFKGTLPGQANYGYLPAGSSNQDCGCGG